MKLLTWLDIRRVIARNTNFYHNLPSNISRIGCFSDALEIGIKTSDDKEEASKNLKDWFGDWYEEDKSIIHLDLADSVLPVEFIDGENPLNSNTSIFPFWQEISYLESQDSEDNSQAKNVQYPEPFRENTNLVAFHSFKGGVGRTLHLVAYLFALLDRAKELNQAITLLIIDADLEAPGLTYLNANEAMQPEVSFIDFLEVYHYPPIENSLELFANKIKKSSKQEGRSTIYFLPAFVKEEQLLDTPVLPENLAKNLNNHWGCADAIYELGRILNADYVLIDLRAGLSEISSPLLFDPRIERFLITTLNKQSIKGTSLVLKQINHVAPVEEKVREGEYSDPSIIITMLTDTLKKSSDYEDAVTELQKSYKEPEYEEEPEEKNLVDTRISINDTFFAEELMYINTWEEAREKLSGTPVFELAKTLSRSNIKLLSDVQDPSNIVDREKVNQLKETCQKYIYAEEGESEELLITEPLKNLASTFQDSLPNIVSLGSKGAGKTFNYIQLSRLKKWDNFLQKANIIKINENQIESTYIFPFLQSTNLKDKAKSIIDEVRQDFLTQLDINSPTFSFSNLRDRIKNTVDTIDNELTENKWNNFWVREIGRSLGIVSDDNSILKLSDINNYLKSKSLRVIYLFDGLEDIFPTISSNKQEQIALKSLIDNLPLKLSEIRQANLGIIIFLRRDFLRHTITQNVLQFENKYRAYDLIWDEISFLKLSLWLCIQAQVIDCEPEELETLGREGLQDKLEKVWGKKLGKDESKEAYSYLWIFNALTDFKNRLQARDIVRFLYFAAEKTVDNCQNVQFTKWASSRLLPPQAVRRALKPCSEEKVKEAKEEYLIFKNWVDSLPEFKERKVPFSSQQLNMDSSTINLLKDMGVIYEDIAKDNIEKFYIPEIFREGLGFSYAKGARPRVLALKRKSS